MKLYFVIASVARRSILIITGLPRRLCLLAMTSLILLTACAHQADLKTPSQIAKDEVKAKEKAANAIKRKEKLAERDAERARDLAKNPPPMPTGNEPAPTAPVDTDEVSVPMGSGK
jgi:hypothetical protein